MADHRVIRNDGENRYEIWADDELAGFGEYTERDDRTVFTHTEVSDAFAGQGLAKTLAAGALDDMVQRGRVIVPVCPFVVDYVRKHPEYEPHIAWPRDGKDE
jgi:predicted GNAT family acetyltransferase